jgi:peptidoglycan/LPS O-acetylase OafA/YrhL
MRWLAAVVLAAVLSWPWLARAANEKDPLDYPIGQYGLMLGVALLGGLVSWWAKVRKGEAKAWHISGLVGELCTSAFAGLLAFWLCEWAATPPLLTASLVGIAGHMGTRAIGAFEEFAQKRYGAKP